MSIRPKIGDIIELAPPNARSKQLTHGIVLQVRVHKDDTWSMVEVYSNKRRRWISRAQIAHIVGRPRGISRIDQPTRRTHGWFVRLGYRGKTPRVARLFSDQKYQGIDQSLRAAIDFYTDQQVEGQAIEAQ